MGSRPDQALSVQQYRVASWIWLGTIAASLGLIAAASTVSPDVPVGPITGFLVGFGAVAGVSMASAAACPPIRRRALWLVLVPIAVLWAVTESPRADLGAALLVAGSLLFGGTLVGAIVGGEVEHAGYLLYVAVVSSVVDVTSVFHPKGPSAVLAASPVAVTLVAVPFPIAGTDRIGPLLGVGDVVFTALYLAWARRHGLPRHRTLVALGVGFAVTAAVVVWSAQAIPALPFLGAAVLAAHPEARRPPPNERVRGMVMMSVIVAICALVLLLRYT